MKNRYGQEFGFEKMSDSLFLWKGESRYCRFGIIDDSHNYSFFDPAGGPYIATDEYMIRGLLVKRIFWENGSIYFEVAA